MRPCEVDKGEPCRQCNRRVTGTHHSRDDMIRTVQTRAQRKRNIECSDMEQLGCVPQRRRVTA